MLTPNESKPLSFFPVVEDSWGMACRIGNFLTTASALACERSSLSAAALGIGGGVASKLSPAEKHRLNSRLYWRRLRQDPERRRLYNMRKAMEWRRRKERQQQHRRSADPAASNDVSTLSMDALLRARAHMRAKDLL